MVVFIILVALLLLGVAIAIPGLLAMWRYPRRFGLKTHGFDTPAYLGRREEDRARRSRERTEK